MIVEDICKNRKTGVIQLTYDGEYPSEEEIFAEVEKFFGKDLYTILEIESDGTSGKVYLI